MLKKKKIFIIIFVPILLVFIWLLNPLSIKDHSIKLINELNITSTISNTLKEEGKNKFNDKSSRTRPANSAFEKEPSTNEKNDYQNKESTSVEKFKPQNESFPIGEKKEEIKNIAQDDTSVSNEKSNNKIYNDEPPYLQEERVLEKNTLTSSNLIKVIQEKSLYISILLCLVEVEKSIILGHPYTGQVNLLKELLTKSDNIDIDLAQLIKNANSGLPSRIELYNEFQLIRLKILSLPTEDIRNMNFFERAHSKISSLILITKNPDNKDNKLRTILDKIEKEVTSSNINNILNQYEKLSGANKKIMNNWVKKIETLQDIQLLLLDIKKRTIKNLASN